jgi:hypothetical protein
MLELLRQRYAPEAAALPASAAAAPASPRCALAGTDSTVWCPQDAGDDVIDDIHTQTGTALPHLGGEEGIEDLAQRARSHADAVIDEAA